MVELRRLTSSYTTGELAGAIGWASLSRQGKGGRRRNSVDVEDALLPSDDYTNMEPGIMTENQLRSYGVFLLRVAWA